eukprot:6312296-Ditylum_brightwellii.AAC.1
MLPPLQILSPFTANTTGSVYSEVKTLRAANKWPISALTEAINDITGEELDKLLLLQQNEEIPTSILVSSQSREGVSVGRGVSVLQQTEDAVEETAPITPSTETVETTPAEVERGQCASGNRCELLVQLVKAIENNAPVLDADEATERNPCMNGLEITAFWQPLTLNEQPVPEQENEDTSLRAPTEYQNSMEKTWKYGFSETFTRPEFTGKDMYMIQNCTYQSRTQRRLSSA